MFFGYFTSPSNTGFYVIFDKLNQILYNQVNHVEYRQKDCFELCLQKMIIDTCGCFYTWLPIYGNTSSPCFNIDQFICLAYKFNESTSEIESLCKDSCPLECSYVNYELSMSSLVYPTKEFFHSLKYNSSEYTLNKYRQTHLGLDIFFPIKQYTEIRETPKTTFPDLISNIGGALGVFLGLSIFSFIELFEVIFQILLILSRRKILETAV